MKLSVKGFANSVRLKASVLAIVCIMLAPAAVNAQNDDGDEPAVESGGNGPWGNSAGSTIGSAGSALSSGTARPADPNLTQAGAAAARPAAGPTPDATGGPGGNPDVPFDSNMNILFLVSGVAFAYVVYRRRLKLKAIPVKE